MPNAAIRIRPEPFYRREAIEGGLRRVGYTISSIAEPQSPDDLLVIWNRKRGKDDEDATRWEAKGGVVLVIENGYCQKVDKSMYAISVGQHNGAGWFPVGDEDRFSSLGFEVKPWQRNEEGGHVLVCGQRGIGSPLMASPHGWGERETRSLLRQTHREVRLRVHPGNHAPKIPLEQDLRKAHVAVIWSSAAGVRALLEGVPVLYAAPHWVCQDGALPYKGHTDVAMCDDRQRLKALHRMSWGQWPVAEIAAGEPFARMKELNWGRSTCH